MHAAPPVRVRIKPHPAAAVLVLGLLSLAAAVQVLWFARLGLGSAAAGLASVVLLAVAGAYQAARSGRKDTVLHWDGQRWFAQPEGQNSDPSPGQLWLHLDVDGHSLLRFAPERRQSEVNMPRWLVASPATVQGPWQDWRAALVHAQRAARRVVD
jgi:hypothetical protein